MLDEIFETEGVFPPEEGEYTVSYDTSFLMGVLNFSPATVRMAPIPADQSIFHDANL